MKTMTGLMIAVMALIAATACASGSERVARERFPECFAEPVIGASSGAKCAYDEGTKEWRITFWHGWGDCPAGCINREDTAWYKVDGKGRVLQCDWSFKQCHESKPGEVVPTGAGPVVDKPPAKPPAKPDPGGPAYCESHDECFWYECCETKPMSRRYRDAHAAELFLQGPGRESCDLKCLHELVPADRRLACVYHACAAVAKDAPAVDPKRPTVWVGRSRVIGQCQTPETNSSPAAPGAPIVIMTAFAAPVPAGPQFTQWIDEGEKERYEADRDRFMCEACDICKTFAREYRLIYFDDLGKYLEGPEPWRRLDQ